MQVCVVLGYVHVGGCLLVFCFLFFVILPGQGKIYIIGYYQNTVLGASLVTQRLRICLLMQGTRVQALVWKDPTCRGAAGPVRHNY